MRKQALIVAAVAALIVGAAVLLVSRIDSESIGKELVRQANAIDGVELSVTDFDLGIFSGLRLGKTKATLDMPSGRVDAELESLTFEHELMPLLRGQVSVKQIRLDRPVLVLVSRDAAASGSPGGATPEPAGSAAASPLSVAIQQVLVRDGRISASAENVEGSFEADGIDVTWTDIALDPSAGPAVLGLSAKGTLAVESVRFGGLSGGHLTGEMTIAKGVLKATAVLRGGGGQVTAESFQVDAGRDPIRYAMALKGKIDLGEVLGEVLGGGFGLADMEMTASGEGPESKDMVGEGVIRMAEGTMPATLLLAGMEKFLGKSALEGSSYEATEVRFKIANNRIVLEPFRLAGERMRIDASGWVDFDGPLSLEMAVGVPKGQASTGEIPEQQAAAMTDAEGWTTIPLLVSGTSEEPKVGLDKSAMANTAKARASDAAKKGLRKLFER